MHLSSMRTEIQLLLEHRSFLRKCLLNEYVNATLFMCNYSCMFCNLGLLFNIFNNRRVTSQGPLLQAAPPLPAAPGGPLCALTAGTQHTIVACSWPALPVESVHLGAASLQATRVLTGSLVLT